MFIFLKTENIFQTAILKLFWSISQKLLIKSQNQNICQISRKLFSTMYNLSMFILQQFSKEWERGIPLLLLLVFCKSVYLCMDLYFVCQASFLYMVSLLLNPSLGTKNLVSPLPIKPLFSLTTLEGQIS